MALVKIGFISDSHYAKAADDSGDLFRSHAIGKLTQALNHFIAEGVDVICTMGDMVENPEECYDPPYRLHELARLINGHGPVPHNIPVLWCVGNHDVDDTTGPDKFKADWCAETGATCIDNGINHEGDIVRDFLDLGTKLRIVSLDNQFNSSFISLPVTQTYGYVHPDELTWLEIVLSEADAAGRFSVVLTHMPLVFTTQIGNAADVLNIVKAHNVIGCFAGHSHQEHLADGDQNPLSEVIRHFIIPDIRRGDFDTNGDGPYSIVQVDVSKGWIQRYNGYHFPATWNSNIITNHEWIHPPEPTGQKVIAAGAAWKYNDSFQDLNTAYNTGQHPNWTDPDFDDSGWASGNAPLGYGETWLNTVLTDPGTGNRDKCAYFRKKITLANVAQITQLYFRAMRDDGIVIYINGIECARLGMAAGQVDQRTLANVNVYTDPPEQTWFDVTDITYPDPVGLLVEGENTIAVELHNTAATSPDLEVDIEMLVERLVGSVCRITLLGVGV